VSIQGPTPGWIGENADLITLSGEGQPRTTWLRDGRSQDDRTQEDGPTVVTKQATFATLLRIAGGGATVIAGLLLLVTLFLFFTIHHQVSDWPRTIAQVEKCETYWKTSAAGTEGGGSVVYGFHCSLSYMANSQPYRGQADLGYRNGDRNAMSKWLSHFRRGDHIQVAYDPTYPAHVCFVDDFPLAYASPLASLRLAAWNAVVGAILLMVGRSMRTAPVGDLPSTPRL
jgi:hypothetical protein